MRYDAIIIGTGQAGPSLAAHLAGGGQRVAIAEGGKLGGSCVNYGCTPTKTLRAAARVAHQARRSGEYGIRTGDVVSVDFAAVMDRVHRVVDNSRSGLTEWLEGVDGLDIYRDYAAFDGTHDGVHRVRVGDDVLESERVFLNTGTRAFIPPVDGLQNVDYLTNVSVMQLRELPQHLMILGGGYIGVELGQIFRRLGSEVTIIEGAPHIAAREDDDVIEELERILTAEGVNLITGYLAQNVTQEGGSITVSVANKSGDKKTVTGTHLLVATGRKLNTDKLGLDTVGVDVGERGVIKTNGRLETSVAGIWALGDINGRGAFTHTSVHDYEIVRDNLAGKPRSADERVMAYCMYSDPPLGRVGMNEKQARESGKNVLMSRMYMKNVSRAKEDGELNGLVKLLVDADTEQFLGATIFGMQGDDVVQVVSNYMATGASYRHMQQSLPIHPTISEFFPTWLSSLEPLE